MKRLLLYCHPEDFEECGKWLREVIPASVSYGHMCDRDYKGPPALYILDPGDTKVRQVEWRRR